MTLVSIQGWDKLLYMIVEDNGQPWMGESLYGQFDFPIIRYSPAEFIRSWQPEQKVKQ